MNPPADTVQIVEVGARDGLQNEATRVKTADKLELLTRLAQCGLRRIEATACVSPARVPQMADYPQILAALPDLPAAQWSVLVANRRGLAAALTAAVPEIALFTAASDAFAEKNIGCKVADSLLRFMPLAQEAKAARRRVRGYISTVVRCPYSGAVKPAQVAALARQLIDIGCDEIALGDTIGVGVPTTVQPVLTAVLSEVAVEKTAVHFHDTNGSALANIACALEAGIRIVDASVGGLGGCPFAPGASGNVATEAVGGFLAAQGFATGINVEAVQETGRWVRGLLNAGSDG